MAQRFKKRAIPAAVKRAVMQREVGEPREDWMDAKCFYCGAPGKISRFRLSSGRFSGHVALWGLEFDHLIPESKGGPAIVSNIVLACRRCNRSKCNRSAPKPRREA